VTTPVDPHRWARIADLFERALSVREEDRAAWLVAVSGNDTALHDEVASLLRVHQRADGFISTPAALPPQDERRLAAGVSIGPYRVERVIGAGGMGIVYLAEDSRLGRQVAVKMVAPASDGDAARIERLRREARVAASLAHPNIATVFALEEYEGRLYMVSEYVAGETLRERLSRGPVAVDEAIATVATVARALAEAHVRGIVHRDLKPENIVRTPEGAIKILDFGLAMTDGHHEAGLTADGAAPGTPAYMSPEQIRGTGVDARSDQFAIGVLLYELVTGRHPFLARSPAATLARILEAAPDPLPLPAAGDDEGLMDRLNGVVNRCLQKRADQRYSDTAALAAALARLTQPSSGTTPSTSGRDARWWWQFHQAAVAVAYALLLIPLWRVRHMLGTEVGVPLFLVALVAAVAAGALRLHLWFAARQYPDQWLTQHREARRWVRTADVIFAALLLTEGAIAARTDDPSAPLLVAAATVVTIAFLVIEPATTRAAHGGR
jgi:hypothetical protein